MNQDITPLQEAYKQKKITLYLGAGVSVANGLPSWEQLVLAMYFSIVGKQKMEGWRPLPNYLFAISKWYLSKLNQPLDITMRKLQKYFSDSENGDQKFLDTLYQTLYSGLLEKDGSFPNNMNSNSLRQTNTTLDAVARLCEHSNENYGIKDVVTYNYDDFLEISLKNFKYQTVYKDGLVQSDKLPIYHVHGYMPIRRELAPSTSKDLVFTEYQYNKVATNPEHWSNKVQMQSMSGSVGVMVGLSLADRNMRRLLYTLRDKSVNTCNYILLKRDKIEIKDDDLDGIHEQAIEYFENFQKSGDKHDFSSSVMSAKPDSRDPKKKSSRPTRPTRPLGIKSAKITTKQERPDNLFDLEVPLGIKSERITIKQETPVDLFDLNSEPSYRYEIRSIIQKIEEFDWDQQEFVMSELGIKPIWYNEYEDIPNILKRIAN